MVSESMALFLQRLTSTATTWLVCAVGVLLVAWIVILCRQNDTFARCAAWFYGLTPLGKAVALVAVCLCTMWGGSKEGGDGGGDRGMPVPVLGEMSVQVMEPPDFAVTDLCFTAISPAETSVFVSVAWPTNWTLPLSLLAIYARHDLAAGVWAMVADAFVPSGASAVDIEIPHAILPEGGTNRAFFALGTYDDTDGDGIPDAEELMIYGTDPNSGDTDGDGMSDVDELAIGTSPLSSDTDGDGLSDGDEHGGIMVLPQFEWYDMSAFPAVHQYSSGGGGLASYFGASVSLYGMPSTVLGGVDCNSLIAFENGYVALLAPDDFSGWYFPSFPVPMSGDAFNSGSILIAPYWSRQWVRYDDATSYLKAGSLPSNDVTVVEFRNIAKYQSGNMTMQVIIPGGTGDVVRVSYLSSDFPLDGSDAIAGIQNKRRTSSNGYYNIEWDFAMRGPMPVGYTVEYRFGFGSSPLSADSDNDGLSDSDEVSYGTNPWNADTDNDGLTDSQEVAYGTNPNSADTDGDGLDDAWEHQYGLDPLSDVGGNGAGGDPDGDGLTNLEEQALGTNPMEDDTDDDGLSDGAEIVAGTDPLNGDTDYDGLLDGAEGSVGTDPLQPDTDGDGMYDGWEHSNGFDPLTHNSETPRTDDDGTADPDGDGLTNSEECDWGTNPVSADSDGDGVGDGAEIGQNSDPADATDLGAPNSRVAVPFYFGDHSGSHSEKYILDVRPEPGSGEGTSPRAYSWLNAQYGECETKTAMLKPGWRYEITLRHSSTDPEYVGPPRPDYDYSLRPVTNNLPPYVVFSDPGGLFGVDGTSTAFAGKGKKAQVSVYRFTVNEIWFNHDLESCTLDAVSIRKNARDAYDAMHGEWWLGGETPKNDPVCYAGGVTPKVKVKFKVSPRVSSAEFYAEKIDSSSPLGGLSAQNVTFSDGASSWVEFASDAMIPRTVRKVDHRWEWKVSKIGSQDVTSFVCATTGPHRVYVVRNKPVEPAWRQTARSEKNAWADVLDFACGVANGLSESPDIVATITSHLFWNMNFVYNKSNGTARYYINGIFNLSGYLSRQQGVVNCLDQSYAVAALANILGIEARVVELHPFGYIKPLNLIGTGLCNNPAFQADGDRVRPQDDAGRSRFKFHAFVWSGYRVYDACLGPVLGMGYIPYLVQAIDYSTAAEQDVGFMSTSTNVVKRIDEHEVYLLK